LNQAKAFDKKTTFLHYVVLVVQRNNELLIRFKDDLPTVLKADKVYWDQCLSDLEEVENQLENVRRIALYEARELFRHRRRRRPRGADGDGNGDGSDGSLSDASLTLEEEVRALRASDIGAFTLDAIKKVSALRDRVEGTKDKFARLLEYFGEEDKDLQPHDLFQIICAFVKDFDKARGEVTEKEKAKQRQERKRLQAQQQAGCAKGQGLPPLGGGGANNNNNNAERHGQAPQGDTAKPKQPPHPKATDRGRSPGRHPGAQRRSRTSTPVRVSSMQPDMGAVLKDIMKMVKGSINKATQSEAGSDVASATQAVADPPGDRIKNPPERERESADRENGMNNGEMVRAHQAQTAQESERASARRETVRSVATSERRCESDSELNGTRAAESDGTDAVAQREVQKNGKSEECIDRAGPMVPMSPPPPPLDEIQKKESEESAESAESKAESATLNGPEEEGNNPSPASSASIATSSSSRRISDASMRQRARMRRHGRLSGNRFSGGGGAMGGVNGGQQAQEQAREQTAPQAAGGARVEDVAAEDVRREQGWDESSSGGGSAAAAAGDGRCPPGSKRRLGRHRDRLLRERQRKMSSPTPQPPPLSMSSGNDPGDSWPT